MTNLTDAQLSKLPKYVSQEISRLDSNIGYWQRKFEATLGGPDDSMIAVRRFEGGDMPLPEDATIVLRPDEHTRVEVHIDGAPNRRRVRIQTDGRMNVVPWATNAITIKDGEL